HSRPRPGPSLTPTTTTDVVSGASSRPTTNCTKPSSIMAGTAGKPVTLVTNCMKRASAAGTSIIVGGRKTPTAGTPIATGTTTITTVTNRGPFPRSAPFAWSAFSFHRKTKEAGR